MNIEEIRDLEDSDIRDKIEETQEELFRLRFRSATQLLENPMLVRTLKRDIARMKTVLRERELEQVES
jgi:large subunit ribosomal protein L29